jgi:hypothetical protein
VYVYVVCTPPPLSGVPSTIALFCFCVTLPFSHTHNTHAHMHSRSNMSVVDCKRRRGLGTPTAAVSTTSLTTLNDIPPELLWMVLERLTWDVDMFCAACVNSYCRSVALRVCFSQSRS